MKKFKSVDEYRQNSHDEEGDLICVDCREKYKNFQDLVISDELWNKISPSPSIGGGILCPTCILNRLGELKIDSKGHFELIIRKDE